MENKIQELTDKIYREGVEKGNEEAQRLVSEAQAQAEKLIEDAKKQAESILAEAKKSADALKTEVANLLTNQTVEETVKGFTADKEFLYKFILALAEKWSANEPIEISVKDADSLKKYFTAKAKALLDKGVTINQVNGMKMLFSISPADGSYKVNFGEEEFENYFKEFLRPQLVKMLF